MKLNKEFFKIWMPREYFQMYSAFLTIREIETKIALVFHPYQYDHHQETKRPYMLACI